MKKRNISVELIVTIWIVLWSINFANLQMGIMLFGSVIFVIVIRKNMIVSRKFVSSVLFIIFFSLIYAMMCFANQVKGIGFVIMYAIIPMVAFVLGYIYLLHTKKGAQLALVQLFDTIIFSMFSYASMNMIYLFKNGWSYVQRGTMDVWTRKMINPTNQGGYVALVCIYLPVIILCFHELQILGKRKRIIYLCIILASTVYTLLLGNRTFLILLVASLIVGYYIYLGQIQNKIMFILKTILIGVVLGIIVWMIYNFNIGEIRTFWERTTFYTRMQYMGTQYDRTLVENDRFPTWLLTIRTIPQYVFGGRPEGTILAYAHNLWLDVQWVGGVMPLIALIAVTICFLKTMLFVIKQWRDDKLMKVLTISFTVTILLEFMVEPIIEGYFYLFISFFILWGALLASVEVRRK